MRSVAAGSEDAPAEGRLRAAGAGAPPAALAADLRTLGPGAHELRLPAGGSAWLAVPPGAGRGPVPLAVLLHGAGGSGRRMLDAFAAAPVDAGFLVLAPDSHDSTWDVIGGGFGADVAHIGDALAAVSAAWAVDPCATVLGGFSDGASYALSLGLTNGDRFSHLVAFSPGFMVPAALRGRPAVFVSHGRADRVLPVACSRRITAQLEGAGRPAHYVEYDGEHHVPAAVVDEALAWVARTPSCADASHPAA